MSAYAITTNLLKTRLSEERLIQLTDDSNTGAIVQTAIDEAITSAEAELHLYAGVYYATPLRKSDGVTVPDGVRELLTDSVCWRLMTRRPEFLRNSEDEGKYWEARRDEILRWLRAIANADASRRLLIPGAVEASAATVRAGEASVSSDAPRFSGESMKGFFS